MQLGYKGPDFTWEILVLEKLRLWFQNYAI